MKKLLSLLVCFLTFIGAYAVEPVPVFEIHDHHILLPKGINADGQWVYVNVEKQGNDAKYTIYKPDFSVDRTFTIKDGYTYVKGMEKEPSHPDYTTPTSLTGEGGGINVDAIQGLGDDRDKWFVVIESYTDWHPVGEWYSQYDWSYAIYDESGNKIFDSLSFAKSVDGYFIKYCYIDSLRKTYLVTQLETEDSTSDEPHYLYQFWDLSGNSAVNAPMTVKRTSRAYPNPLHQGRQLTIELSEAAPEGTTVVVSDMNGAAIYSTPVLTGSEKVVIPSRELRDGNLVYSVMANGNILEKGKIIVR